MSNKTNQLANQNADNEHSQILPNQPNLPTGANPASTEPPCVSNQHENRLVEQSSPIDPVPPTSHKQESVMNKKKEVTQHSTAKDTSQIVPTGANLPRLTLVKRGDQEILSADTTDLTEWYDELAAAFASKNKDRD